MSFYSRYPGYFPVLKLISICSNRYPAFNAGLILLFHISQQVLKGHHYDQFSEDIADAQKCISTLEYCAQDDEASRCYLVILRPFRELLSRSPGEARDMLQPPSSPQPQPTSPQSQWGSMYSVLADIDGIGRGATSSSSKSPDTDSTQAPSSKRIRCDYSPVHDNPRWTDFHSSPSIHMQQPGEGDGKEQYPAKGLEGLEAFLRRVS